MRSFDYVPHGSREDLDRAVDAAAEAFKTWSVTPFEERAKCLLKFAEEVEKIADELAKAQTMEQGKPLAFPPMSVTVLEISRAAA